VDSRPYTGVERQLVSDVEMKDRSTPTPPVLLTVVASLQFARVAQQNASVSVARFTKVTGSPPVDVPGS
jgi:hypothetical protein